MKLIKLEAVRGFAALYVIIHHTIPKQTVIFNFDCSLLFSFGQEAVITFFLLSGFVIEYSFSKNTNHTFKSYFSKRFLRIYIPLFFVYIISYICTCLQANHLQAIDFIQLLANLFMLQDLESLKPNVITTPLFGNAPLWSLSYEWWFYMIYYPLIKYIPTCKQNKFVSILCISACIYYVFNPSFMPRILSYFAIWWSGVFMARKFNTHKDISAYQCINILMLLIICTATLSISIFIKDLKGIGIHPLLEVRHFAFSICLILCALVWAKYKWIHFNKLLQPFSKIAPISYVLYIAHYPIMAQLPLPITGFQKWIVSFIILIIIATIIELKLYPFISKKLRPIKNDKSLLL